MTRPRRRSRSAEPLSLEYESPASRRVFYCPAGFARLALAPTSDQTALSNANWEGDMDRTASGLVNGLIGVAIFSASLPATRVAVLQFDPLFLTAARAAIAGLLGLGLLLL